MNNCHLHFFLWGAEAPVYSFRIWGEKIQVKNITKNVNYVPIGFSLKLGQFSWLHFAKIDAPSLPDILIHVDRRQQNYPFLLSCPLPQEECPVLCQANHNAVGTWHMATWKLPGWGWNARRVMCTCQSVLGSRCHCGAIARSRRCRQCLSHPGLMPSQVAFLRQVPSGWTLWPETKVLSMRATSQTSSETKMPVCGFTLGCRCCWPKWPWHTDPGMWGLQTAKYRHIDKCL